MDLWLCINEQDFSSVIAVTLSLIKDAEVGEGPHSIKLQSKNGYKKNVYALLRTHASSPSRDKDKRKIKSLSNNQVYPLHPPPWRKRVMKPTQEVKSFGLRGLVVRLDHAGLVNKASKEQKESV